MFIAKAARKVTIAATGTMSSNGYTRLHVMRPAFHSLMALQARVCARGDNAPTMMLKDVQLLLFTAKTRNQYCSIKKKATHIRKSDTGPPH